MRDFSTSPFEMFASLWRNRSLLRASVKREVLGRYRGSVLGILWSFFNPIFMLTVYTIVFSVVFKARWGGGGDSKVEFALVLFAGLIIFSLFAECINRAPSLVLSNVNFVKKVIYPLEILPAVVLLSAIFHSMISLAVWLLAYILFFGPPPITIIIFPLIVMPFLMFLMGLSWGLASLGVYLRDVAQLTGMATSVLLFLSPIFYPVTALPDDYQVFLYLNPLTPVIEMAREVLYWGQSPDWKILGGYWIATFVVAWAGFAWFQKTRKGFADVL